MLFASVCNINTPGQLKSHHVRQANHFSLPCQSAEPRSRIIATSAVKGLMIGEKGGDDTFCACVCVGKFRYCL
jgi:hypothetical protein